MAGRRRHPRFEVLNTDGVLRVLHDVIVRRTEGGELIAVALEPALAGEVVTMHLVGAHPRGVPVKVLESQPVILDGSVRYRLRLMPVDRKTKRGDPTRRVVRGTE